MKNKEIDMSELGKAYRNTMSWEDFYKATKASRLVRKVYRNTIAWEDFYKVTQASSFIETVQGGQDINVGDIFLYFNDADTRMFMAFSVATKGNPVEADDGGSTYMLRKLGACILADDESNE